MLVLILSRWSIALLLLFHFLWHFPSIGSELLIPTTDHQQDDQCLRSEIPQVLWGELDWYVQLRKGKGLNLKIAHFEIPLTCWVRYSAFCITSVRRTQTKPLSKHKSLSTSNFFLSGQYPSSEEIRRYADESLKCSPLDRKVPTGWYAEHNFKPLKPKTKKPDKAYDPAQHIYRTLTGEPLDTSSKIQR